jgi:hypothetical protein
MLGLNLNKLVFTSTDYKLAVSFGVVSIPIFTLEEVSFQAKGEADTTYIVGSNQPVEQKINNCSYEGSLTMQAGELETALALNGFAFATQVSNGVISIVAFNGLAMAKIFRKVVFTSHSGGTKAKNKDSKVTLNWKAVSAAGV